MTSPAPTRRTGAFTAMIWLRGWVPALSFTRQTAELAHTEQIAIVRQNFGFDLAAGLTSVPLAPDQEHYYLEVRRIK